MGTGGIGPLNPVPSLSVCLSVSRVRQFFWKTAYWYFFIFCMNTSLWEGKSVTFLFFSGKFEIWPFWPIFGQKWPILAQNGLFWSIFGLFFQNSTLTLANFLHKADSQYHNPM